VLDTDSSRPELHAARETIKASASKSAAVFFIVDLFFFDLIIDVALINVEYLY